MGHKVNPTGFRIGINKGWQGKWYADRHYASYLDEDLKIRQAIEAKYPEAAISLIEIERQANQVIATIHTARPGIVIGRGGQRVDEARTYLEKIIGKRIQLNIKEVQQPELDARLVARSIAEQLERRIAYRRAMKQAIARTIQAGGKGIKVTVSGRLGEAEIARSLNMHEGRVPLHTLRADIDYGFTEAHTVMGHIGIKTWIYRGDILPEAKTEETESGTPAVEPVAVTTEGESTAAEAKDTYLKSVIEEKLKAALTEAEQAEEKPTIEEQPTGAVAEEVQAEVTTTSEKKVKAEAAQAKPKEIKTATVKRAKTVSEAKPAETKATAPRKTKTSATTKEETAVEETIEPEAKPVRTRKKAVRKTAPKEEVANAQPPVEPEEEDATT
jgi:small subunit ribosomal protein S3